MSACISGPPSFQAPIPGSALQGAAVPNAGKPAFSGLQAAKTTDSVRFGGDDENAKPENTENQPRLSQETKTKWMNGLKEAGRAVFNKNGLIDDATWIGALSVALFFIPGHQILSVPFVPGVGAAMRAYQGFKAGKAGQRYEIDSYTVSAWHWIQKKLGRGKKAE